MTKQNLPSRFPDSWPHPKHSFQVSKGPKARGGTKAPTRVKSTSLCCDLAGDVEGSLRPYSCGFQAAQLPRATAGCSVRRGRGAPKRRAASLTCARRAGTRPPAPTQSRSPPSLTSSVRTAHPSRDATHNQMIKTPGRRPKRSLSNQQTTSPHESAAGTTCNPPERCLRGGACDQPHPWDPNFGEAWRTTRGPGFG